MHIVVHNALAVFDPQQWNGLLDDNNPFMRHEFLHGLEISGCVTAERGWQPSHIACYDGPGQSKLLGAMPCYIKDHSYGEYIFDWAWADAHQRHGLSYYPKLSNAVPFTPATGPRWLAAKEHEGEIIRALLNKAISLVNDQNLSGFHSLFMTQKQAELAARNKLSLRSSSQFHWHNYDYRNFNDFVARMTAKKRKNINRERRRVVEQGVAYRWLSGSDLTAESVTRMYQFYLSTIRYYGAQAYLNEAFFLHLAENFSQQTLFLFATYNDQIIAGGLYLRSDDTLYGRYWGALNNFHSVHFETCYYQPIEWCINNGFRKFEAGAQGQHKLARGLEPSTTYSAHWIADPQFRAAIDDFLHQESEHVHEYAAALQQHSPFKREV